MATISLGDINFLLNPETGYYDQSPDVTRLLMFYTRNLYCKVNSGQKNSFTADQQKIFLDYLRKNCQTLSGDYVINHVNKVFLMTLSSPLNFNFAPALSKSNQELNTHYKISSKL